MNGNKNRPKQTKKGLFQTKKGDQMKRIENEAAGLKRLTPDNARIGMKVTYYTGSGGKTGHIGRGTIIGFRNWNTAIVRFGKKTVKHLSISSMNRA